VFDYGPDSFYQPNPLQAINIYNKIVEFANTSGNESVYDLYTGIGTIASVLTKHVSKVVGIEGSANAIENAKKNSLINKIRNVDFITGDILETFKPSFVEQYGKPDIIVLDPPRSGTLTEIKKTILWAEPSKIIYLSCNPVSLAWDLKQLTEKYEVTKMQPYDMFPHTHHLETLVLLELRK
jgi:23S rRNA (uracil1939-C5)-methyltransferase